MVDTITKIIQKMFFLAFSKINANFAEQKLTWRSYIAVEILSTTKKIKIINQKKFALAGLTSDKEVFMVYVAFFGLKIIIDLAWKAQINLLVAKKKLLYQRNIYTLLIFFWKIWLKSYPNALTLTNMQSISNLASNQLTS